MTYKLIMKVSDIPDNWVEITDSNEICDHLDYISRSDLYGEVGRLFLATGYYKSVYYAEKSNPQLEDRVYQIV